MNQSRTLVLPNPHRAIRWWALAVLSACVAAMLATFLATPLWAACQEPGTGADSATGTESAATPNPQEGAGPQEGAATLNAAIEKWDAQFVAVQEIVNKLKAAEPADRQTLIPQYQDAIQQFELACKDVEPVLIAAAKEDQVLSEKALDTINDLAQIALSEDAYDRAFRLLEPVSSKEGADPMTLQLAATAAFGCDRFPETKALVERIQAAGNKIQISLLQRSLPGLDARLRDWAVEQEIRAKEAAEDDLPRVKLETTTGDVVIELYENQAPNAVANFISLVEKGYYDGLSFHRVLPQFMAQGGCPTGTGTGGPGYQIDCECYRPDFRKHFSGTLSMAHAGRNTGGSQFFLTFLNTPHLDGKHTAFGRVIEGIDAVAAIEKVDPQRPSPLVKPSKIIKATVIRKRDHQYKPETH